jgi:nucleolar MIF4G domain-containing protein 1
MSAKARGKRPASPEAEREEPARKRGKTCSDEKAPKSAANPMSRAEAKEKRRKELMLPQDDGDVEDREIAWLEYMLKKEKGDEDSDGLDGELWGSP